MNTDTIMADLEWLEDLYSTKMLFLEKINDADERNALLTELEGIHRLISQKAVLYERLKSTELEREKLSVERDKISLDERKVELDKDRIEADRDIQDSKERIEEARIEAEKHVKPLDLNTVVSCAASAVSMIVVGIVELKANGFLNDRLFKLASGFGGRGR